MKIVHKGEWPEAEKPFVLGCVRCKSLVEMMNSETYVVQAGSAYTISFPVRKWCCPVCKYENTVPCGVR